MGWKGMAIGGYLGSFFGGPLGAIIGAVIGHKIEGAAFGPSGRTRRRSGYRDIPEDRRSMVFCASAAAMLAKMAKADGRVTADEIAGVERAFRRLGFSDEARSYAIDVFRKAKDDAHTIYDYAREFASAVDAVEVRELLYELLWDVACADGTVSPAELNILQHMPRALGIRNEWYGYFASRRLGGARGRARQEDDPLKAAYELLGASPSDPPDTLRRKYRELAKKNHPDALRAQGIPEGMIGRATERMSRINEAWATIRAARGI